jgi:hypothetical protein
LGVGVGLAVGVFRTLHASVVVVADRALRDLGFAGSHEVCTGLAVAHRQIRVANGLGNVRAVAGALATGLAIRTANPIAALQTVGAVAHFVAALSAFEVEHALLSFAVVRVFAPIVLIFAIRIAGESLGIAEETSAQLIVTRIALPAAIFHAIGQEAIQTPTFDRFCIAQRAALPIGERLANRVIVATDSIHTHRPAVRNRRRRRVGAGAGAGAGVRVRVCVCVRVRVRLV